MHGPMKFKFTNLPPLSRLSGQTFCAVYHFSMRFTCHACLIFLWFNTRFEPRRIQWLPSPRHPWFCSVSQGKCQCPILKCSTTTYTEPSSI